MSTNGVLALQEVRASVAAALAPTSDTDPEVLADLVDSVTPPALMLEWNDPWVTLRSTAGARGLFDAQLNVLCIAGRVEPGPGIETLEQLVAYTLGRVRFPLIAAQAPRVFEIANLPLLGARLSFRVPVSVEGGT